MVNVNGNDEIAINGVEKTTSIVFLQSSNISRVFDDNNLSFRFPLYKKTGNLFEFNNNVFMGLNQKINIEFHILYNWINIEYAPRFNFLISLNNNVYINRNLGISDELNGNLLSINFIINLNVNDKLDFSFVSDFDKNTTLEIVENSYYIFRTL